MKSRVTDVKTILFFKTNKTAFIEYAVAYFVKMFKTSGGKRDFLVRIVERPLVAVEYHNELFMSYSVQPALYNITITSEIATISISIISGEFLHVNVDNLVSDRRFTETDVCPQEKTTANNKLHECPYIKLRTDEIVFDVQYGYLFIRRINFLGQKPAKRLSQWEYEIDNGNITVCLQGDLDIYLACPNTLFSKPNVAKAMYSLSAAWCCILLLEIDI